MAQCEKIQDNGQRCSNQSVPGTKFCQTHSRIAFKKVDKPAEVAKPQPTPPPPAPPQAKEKPKPAEAKLKQEPKPPVPEWKAIPSAAGQAPTFPGLKPDERNILVASQGTICLPADQASTAASQFGRLVSLMSYLSQATALPKQVRITRQSESGSVLVHLSPIPSADTKLSAVYDAASAAARLVDARLYIGENNAFVQYRDDAAPRGYDVPSFKPSASKTEILLIGINRTQGLDSKSFAELPLADFCLLVKPIRDVAGSPPDQIYALMPPSLYPLLAKYLRAHRLHFTLARLQANASELFLFEINSLVTSSPHQSVPVFVLDYLSRLPRVVVFQMALERNQRRILVQWQHRLPLNPTQIADAFGANETILFIADEYSNLRITPSPQFFDGDHLTDILPGSFQPMTFSPESGGSARILKLPIVLRPDNGPTPPIAALILNQNEIRWLRQFLYRLPANAFGGYALCQGKDTAVLLGGANGVEGIPFGIPLRRLGDTEIFIPLRSRFVPELALAILREAIRVKPSEYVFLTDTYRLDLAVGHFQPLSRSLMADPNRPNTRFELQATTSLPDLVWTSPPEPPKQTHREEQGKRGGVLDRVFRGSSAPVSPHPTQEETVKINWRTQARVFEESKDFLAAALCYSFANDRNNLARCYRLAITAGSAQAK